MWDLTVTRDGCRNLGEIYPITNDFGYPRGSDPWSGWNNPFLGFPGYDFSVGGVSAPIGGGETAATATATADTTTAATAGTATGGAIGTGTATGGGVLAAGTGSALADTLAALNAAASQWYRALSQPAPVIQPTPTPTLVNAPGGMDWTTILLLFGGALVVAIALRD